MDTEQGRKEGILSYSVSLKLRPHYLCNIFKWTHASICIINLPFQKGYPTPQVTLHLVPSQLTAAFPHTLNIS